MKTVSIFAIALVLAALATTAVLWSGVYNIAADELHWPLTHTLIAYARERSIDSRIDARMAATRVPDLAEPARIASGAGNYNAMCVGCHLKPGVASSELSTGLYPRPPDLTRARNSKPMRDFWIVKHGIKMSGMPAWGKSMNDSSMWAMVAFLQKLPQMTPPAYAALVEASPGHAHGDGKTNSSQMHDELSSVMQHTDAAAPPQQHEHDDQHEHRDQHEHAAAPH